MGKQRLLNTFVNNVSMDETVTLIEEMIHSDRKTYVVPINVDVVMKMEKDSYLKKIVDTADLVLTDGKPLIWISNIQRRPIKEKVSGSDLVPLLCGKAAEKNYRIFIIGGKDGVAEQAKQKLEMKFPKINIAGVYAPPMGFEKDPEEVEHINRMVSAAHPDLLIVCLGCPKQEKWIYENYKKYDAKVSVCAGATVDFLSGQIKRAPKWMRECGLEWFYRFLQEPRRMFKRYFIDDMKIIRLMFKYRKTSKGK
ncbi:MAG: WecB/TagA/CpsF family glycosyltransferase [Lachnospiraceae bacterium]|nr:WecB/TagA/CpsF family glycosyltransferase [Lachnospiraceae bacterium]